MIMKKSELTFSEGFTTSKPDIARAQGNKHLAFDWDKAAAIIKEHFEKHPDLHAEAGLQGDWSYTGGTIFKKGFPINSSYTYLASNWAKPTLILSWDGDEQLEVECSIVEEGSRFSSDSKWDEKSMEILGINMTLVTDEDED